MQHFAKDDLGFNEAVCLFKHTPMDNMKDRWTHTTSLLAFLAERGVLGAALNKHTHECGVQRTLGDDNVEDRFTETGTSAPDQFGA